MSYFENAKINLCLKDHSKLKILFHQTASCRPCVTSCVTSRHVDKVIVTQIIATSKDAYLPCIIAKVTIRYFLYTSLSKSRFVVF